MPMSDETKLLARLEKALAGVPATVRRRLLKFLLERAEEEHVAALRTDPRGA